MGIVTKSTKTKTSKMTKFDRQTMLLRRIKGAGADGVKRTDLASESKFSAGTLTNDMTDLIAKGCVRMEKRKDESNRFPIVVYFYVSREAEEVPEMTITEPPVKKEAPAPIAERNSEGYPDPTAGVAIASAMEDVKVPGEIWSRRCANGDTHDFLVLSSTYDFVTGIQLVCDSYPVELAGSPYIFEFYSTGGKHYRYDAARVTTVPSKYFLKTDQKADEKTLTEVLRRVCQYLRIAPTEKIVEKIKEVKVEIPVEKVVTKEVPVEVIKEVPVEVIKEVPVEESAVTIASAISHLSGVVDNPDTKKIDELTHTIDILEARIEVYREALAAIGGRAS